MQDIMAILPEKRAQVYDVRKIVRCIVDKDTLFEIKPRFVTSHSNVYRAVINGDVVAGGAVNTTLAQEPAQVREMLRVLHTTADYISHPIAAHPRVPAAVRAALVAAFLKSKTDAAGRRLLEKVQLRMPALVTYEKDYAALETLNLGAFVSKAN